MTSTSELTDSTRIPSAKPWIVPGAVIAAIGGALMLAVCNAVVAVVQSGEDVESAADFVRLAADHDALVEAGHVAGLLAAALLVPGIWSVAARLSPRTPKLAALGGWMMATGYVFFLVLSAESMLALAVSRSGGDPAVFVDALDHHLPTTSFATYAVFGVGALGGGLILGIAMLRQKGAVPAWAGWALVASEPVRVIGLMAGIAVGPPLASVLIAVAFGGTLLTRRGSTGELVDRAQPRPLR